MKRLYAITLFALLISLSGCSTREYPYIQINSNVWDFSSENRTIYIGEKYQLNQAHTYDIVETEQGIDVVIHFEEATT